MGMQNHRLPPSSQHQMFIEQQESQMMNQMKTMSMNGYNQQSYPQQQQLPPSQQSIPKKAERKLFRNSSFFSRVYNE